MQCYVKKQNALFLKKIIFYFKLKCDQEVKF